MRVLQKNTRLYQGKSIKTGAMDRSEVKLAF